jgi:glycosyltransferase involved in cell wall biosynthesis
MNAGWRGGRGVGYWMASEEIPVAVGLPVRNGERYLADAIESVLCQTYGDFRLIVCDNASEDGTEEIVRAYAREDRRLVYHRHEANVGAAPNFNFAFRAVRSRYFKWMAHDDVIGPDFLRRCHERMEADEGLSLCTTLPVMIDAAGRVNGTYDHQISLVADMPSERFMRMLWVDHFTEIWGLMRSEQVLQTRLFGSYVGADRTFLAEILLRGRMEYVPDFQLYRRHHPECFCNAIKTDAERLRWFDPRSRTPACLAGPVKLSRYLEAINRAPISPAEKTRCISAMWAWGAKRSYEALNRPSKRYRPRLTRLGQIRLGTAENVHEPAWGRRGIIGRIGAGGAPIAAALAPGGEA